MKLITFVHIIIFALFLFAIYMLVLSIKNKKMGNIKYIKNMCIINVIYVILFLRSFYFVPLIIDFELILYYLLGIVSIILYIIAIIICINKIKKSTNNDKSNIGFKKFIVIALIPLILFILCLSRELYLINSSDMILSCTSDGNGGIGDVQDFYYVFNNKNLNEISIDYDILNYSDRHITKKFKEIKIDELNSLGYNVSVEDEIIITKDSKLMYKKKLNPDYFNIDIDHIYYKSK